MNYEKLVGKKFRISNANGNLYTVAALEDDRYIVTWNNGKNDVSYGKNQVVHHFQTRGWIETDDTTNTALDTQVGGGHYKDFKIQPLEFTMANNLDFIQGNIIKYACRHKTKNGVEDLQKVIHYAQLAIQLQYNESGERQ